MHPSTRATPLLFAALTLVACSEGPIDPGSDGLPSDSTSTPEIVGVRIFAADLRLQVGDTLTLRAEAWTTDGDTISNPDLTWSSSDEAVLLVDSSAHVRAVGAGSAFVRGRAGLGSGEVWANVHDEFWCAMPTSEARSLPRFRNQLAYMAARVPGGLGGVYITAGDTVEFFLEDLSHEEEVADTLHNYYGVPFPTGPDIPRDRYTAIQGTYDGLELSGCAAEARAVLASATGVHGVEIDQRRNRTIVGVEDSATETEVRARFQEARIPLEMILFAVFAAPR